MHNILIACFFAHSNTLDAYCQQLSPEQFSNFNADFFNDDACTTEDSGFLSNPNHSHEQLSETFDLEPEFTFDVQQHQEFFVQNVPQPMAPVPNLIPTWHPTYGNVLMQLVPQIQTPGYFGQFSPSMSMMQAQLMVPYVHGYPISINEEEYFPQHHFAPQKHGHVRAGRNFNKKYPRRSQNGFNVLPYNKRHENVQPENLDDVIMDLRELNIGPDS